MSVLSIPIDSSSPSFSIEVTLEGQSYLLDFHWNERAEGWFFSISDLIGVSLLAGMRLVVGFPMTARYKSELLPPGVFVALDTSGADLDPGISDLGSRVVLQYVESSDLV